VKEKESKPEAKKKENTFWQKTKEISGKTGRVLGIIGKVLFHLRKIFLTIPVVWAGLKVYAYGKENLPDMVGILLQESGDFCYMLEKNSALMSCMAVTAACLVLMFCSRRTIYPWIISLFTLVLPILLVLTNMYPS